MFGGLLLTDWEGSLIDNWVVLKMVVGHFIELLGAEIEQLALDWGVEVMHDLGAELLALNLFGCAIEEVSYELDVVFSK